MGHRAKTKRFGFVVLFLLVAALVAITIWYLRRQNIPILDPKGTVARQELHLMVIAGLLAIIVVVPVFTMAIIIALKYREGNTKPQKYSPDWDHSRFFETIWWGVPLIIIGILSVITWDSSHALDPYKPLASSQPTMTVRVVALNWKWLFIYPQQNIASVNMAQVPLNTPVDFQITSDSVMNSFWVPQLGGQIYAMPGMDTQLNLMADEAGSYGGSSANISGRGFAGMGFTIRASSQASFNNWVKTTRMSPANLTADNYAKLAAPSQNNPVSYYSSVAGGLFDNIMMKYMMPMADMSSTMPMTTMQTNPSSTPSPSSQTMPMMDMPGMSGM